MKDYFELTKRLSLELPFLKEIDRLKKEVEKAKPLQHELKNRVLQKLRLEWNYNSNAIEGNSFTYGETVALLMEGITVKGKPFKDALDIKGHDSAIDLMMSIVREDRPLNEIDIKNLHKILLVENYYSPAKTPEGLETRKLIQIGEYKNSPNHVITKTGETHYYSTPEETPFQMRELVEWYNSTVESKDFHPIVLAALFHHRFVAIHPFDDGNGRMTRLLTNLILLKFGYPISVIKNEIKLDYYARLSLADNGQMIPIVEIIANSVKDSLEIYVKAIKGEDISNPTDIDKEIALFKLELDMTNDRIKERSPELVVQVAYEIFSHLKSKLNQFASMFQSRHEILRDKIGGRAYGVINKELDSLDQFKQAFNSKISKANSVSYLYQLNQDLKGKKKNVHSEVQINFLNKTYEVVYLGNKVTKVYGDKILDTEISYLITLVVRTNMETIKSIYKEE